MGGIQKRPGLVSGHGQIGHTRSIAVADPNSLIMLEIIYVVGAVTVMGRAPKGDLFEMPWF